jgi:hypothetical protein
VIPIVDPIGGHATICATNSHITKKAEKIIYYNILTLLLLIDIWRLVMGKSQQS